MSRDGDRYGDEQKSDSQQRNRQPSRPRVDEVLASEDPPSHGRIVSSRTESDPRRSVAFDSCSAEPGRVLDEHRERWLRLNGSPPGQTQPPTRSPQGADERGIRIRGRARPIQYRDNARSISLEPKRMRSATTGLDASTSSSVFYVTRTASSHASAPTLASLCRPPALNSSAWLAHVTSPSRPSAPTHRDSSVCWMRRSALPLSTAARPLNRITCWRFSSMKTGTPFF
jgi:hypothetical protein